METSPLVVAPVPAELPAPVTDRGWPLLGALPALLTDAPRALLAGAARHPGELFALRFGPVAVPIVSEPDHLQEVLVDNAKDFEKAGMWESTRPLLGNGLVTSDGDFWRRQRRLMQPLFSPAHLASLGETMVGAIGRQLDLLAARSGPVELNTEMALLTQRVLFETMFGSRIDPDVAEQTGRHLAVAFEAMNFQVFLYFLPSWIPRPRQRAFRGSIVEIDRFLQGVVATRRAELARGEGTARVDLLNQLLAAQDADTGEQMTDAQVRDELVTLFSAGLDTTAITLTWLFWLLDTHPEIDARVRAEVDGVLGGRSPTMADLGRLVYTKQAIQEAMRMYPPAWIFPRYTRGGTTIGGRRIAPGTSMLVSPYVTHRNPRYWDDPDRFDPDRFLPERSKGRPRLAFVPFGAGSRQCIGMHFGMMEAQIATAMIVQRFRLRTVPGHEVVPASSSTLKPKHGVPMNVEPIAGP